MSVTTVPIQPIKKGSIAKFWIGMAVVVLTGDIHSNWANDLLVNFDDLDGRAVATEFVGTSISSGGDGTAMPRNREAVMSENPFVKFHNAQRGYVRCEATPHQWKTDFQIVPFVTNAITMGMRLPINTPT